MRSFIRLVAVGAYVVGGGRGAMLQTPTPTVTPAPRISDVELLAKRQDPDAVSLAKVLLTAIPESLRQIAATNVPAVSSILWEEFLDGNKPQWFLDLPYDIQSYLMREFGPSTAWYTAPPTSAGTDVSASATATDDPVETSQGQSSETASDASQTGSVESSRTRTPASSRSTMATSVTSASREGSSTADPTDSTSSPTSTADSDAPPASDSGLSRNQKIGIGVGVPIAILGAAALAFGCCFLLRRRKNKNGSVPPSSPGFIPRFAFQEKSTENLEHRAPLNRDLNLYTHDISHTDWDDDVIEPLSNQPRANTYPPVMNDPKPIMAPALYHTHSSNRARGKRTSYQSLHSVAEVSEPDEAESPVLGRHVSPKPTHHRRTSSSRNLIPPPVPAPAIAQIKRKPVPTSPTPTSPAAQAASNTLLRQTMPEHSGSSSSGLPLSTSSGFNTSSSSGLGLGLANHSEVTSPISPASDHAPKNPFANDYSYVEDYGPEYHGGYLDIEDGLYGGHTSLSRYPEPRKSSRTEWPLRNFVGSGHRRNKSPLWDRVYEG